MHGTSGTRRTVYRRNKNNCPVREIRRLTERGNSSRENFRERERERVREEEDENGAF